MLKWWNKICKNISLSDGIILNNGMYMYYKTNLFDSLPLNKVVLYYYLK